MTHARRTPRFACAGQAKAEYIILVLAFIGILVLTFATRYGQKNASLLDAASARLDGAPTAANPRGPSEGTLPSVLPVPKPGTAGPGNSPPPSTPAAAHSGKPAMTAARTNPLNYVPPVKAPGVSPLPQPARAGFFSKAWSLTKGVGTGLYKGGKGLVTGVVVIAAETGKTAYDTAQVAGRTAYGGVSGNWGPAFRYQPVSFTTRTTLDGKWGTTGSNLGKTIKKVPGMLARGTKDWWADLTSGDPARMEKAGETIGKVAFEVGTLLIPVTKLGSMGKLAKTAEEAAALAKAGRYAEAAEKAAEVAKAAQGVAQGARTAAEAAEAARAAEAAVAAARVAEQAARRAGKSEEIARAAKALQEAEDAARVAATAAKASQAAEMAAKVAQVEQQAAKAGQDAAAAAAKASQADAASQAAKAALDAKKAAKAPGQEIKQAADQWSKAKAEAQAARAESDKATRAADAARQEAQATREAADAIKNGNTLAPSKAPPEGWVQNGQNNGGHAIDKHVGKSDQELAKRLADDAKVSASSSFTNLKTAEGVAHETIRRNPLEIEKWMRSGTTENLPLNFAGDGSTVLGRGIERGAAGITDRTAANVVLQKTPDGKGFIVLTAYPI